MTYSFNLVERPWIPCSEKESGEVRLVGLGEALEQAGRFGGVEGGSPLETAALYRLLLAVTHAALRGPKNRAAWARLWREGLPKEAIRTYLDRWKGRFDLFDSQRPFYQAADERVKKKPLNSLVFEMTAGNAAVLFDHHTDEDGATLRADEAARALVTMQTFGLAGLSGLEQKFTDSPWSRGIIFLIEGDSLWETLCLNLLPYPDAQRNGMESSEADAPAWEQENPHHPQRMIPHGYLDYLTWQGRRIWLFPEGEEADPQVRLMTLAPSLRLDAGLFDPMKLYRDSKDEGRFCVRFNEGRMLWRDSAALFGIKEAAGSHPPQVFHWLASLAAYQEVGDEKALRFMALGMANDQAKVEFFQEDHLPLPVAYLMDDGLVNALGMGLKFAEDAKNGLRSAGQWLGAMLISPNCEGKKWKDIDRMTKDQAGAMLAHWSIERYYWQRLEVPFYELLAELPQSRQVTEKWKEAVGMAAREGLEQAIRQAGDDTQAIKAAVRARGSLGYALKSLFSSEGEEEEKK